MPLQNHHIGLEPKRVIRSCRPTNHNYLSIGRRDPVGEAITGRVRQLLVRETVLTNPFIQTAFDILTRDRLTDAFPGNEGGDRRPDKAEREEENDPEILPRFESLGQNGDAPERNRPEETEHTNDHARTLLRPKGGPVWKPHEGH